jgi:hypothetical protein
MARVEVQFNRGRFLSRLMGGISNGINSGLWGRISYWMLHLVLGMFSSKGGAYGRKTWPAISPSLYGRIREGSMGGTFGVYGSDSQPLQASGRYKASFKTIRQSPTMLKWGSNHKKADRIPYGGWNQGKNNKRARYTPRYAMPDAKDGRFQKELVQQERDWLDAVVKQAILEGGRA